MTEMLVFKDNPLTRDYWCHEIIADTKFGRYIIYKNFGMVFRSNKPTDLELLNKANTPNYTQDLEVLK